LVRFRKHHLVLFLFLSFIFPKAILLAQEHGTPVSLQSILDQAAKDVNFNGSPGLMVVGARIPQQLEISPTFPYATIRLGTSKTQWRVNVSTQPDGQLTVTSPSEAFVSATSMVGQKANTIFLNFGSNPLVWIGITINLVSDTFEIGFFSGSYLEKQVPMWIGTHIKWFPQALTQAFGVSLHVSTDKANLNKTSLLFRSLVTMLDTDAGIHPFLMQRKTFITLKTIQALREVKLVLEQPDIIAVLPPDAKLKEIVLGLESSLEDLDPLDLVNRNSKFVDIDHELLGNLGALKIYMFLHKLLDVVDHAAVKILQKNGLTDDDPQFGHLRRVFKNSTFLETNMRRVTAELVELDKDNRNPKYLELTWAKILLLALEKLREGFFESDIFASLAYRINAGDPIPTGRIALNLQLYNPHQRKMMLGLKDSGLIDVNFAQRLSGYEANFLRTVGK